MTQTQWKSLLSNQTLHELRLHLCQKSPGSQGIRSFIASQYPAMKQANPTLPILVREATGVPARAFARFDLGVEKKVALDGLSESQVKDALAQLLSRQ